MNESEKFKKWISKVYKCSAWRNNWNNLSLKSKLLNKERIKKHDYYYNI